MTKKIAGRSELWHHYEKDALSGKAVCNLCKEKLAYKSTTANLKSHLKRKHVSVFASLSSQTQPSQARQQNSTAAGAAVDSYHLPGPSTSTNSTNETTDGTMINVCKKQKIMDTYINSKKISNEQKQKNNLDLLHLCTDSFHPFSIVEERAFRKFYRWIPGYQLPTRKTLSNSIMQEAYTKLHDALTSQLRKEVHSICLTADMWTSLKTESYIALTGPYR